MPIDPITWILIVGSFFAGAAVAVFWDEIKAWATRVLVYIFDAINRAIEVTSKAVVYLVKEGTRVYKRVEVFVRNIRSGQTNLRYKEKEISRYDVPDDIKNELDQKVRIKVAEEATD